MGSPTRPIRRRSCLAASTGSMARPADRSRPETIAAISALSRTEAERGAMVKPIRASRVPLMVVPLLLAVVGLGACGHAAEEAASVSNDYHHRHPIVIKESDRSLDIFVGTGRGGLSAAQRADVAGLAQDWMREATGTIVAEIPVSTPNARSAADSYREVRLIL